MFVELLNAVQRRFDRWVETRDVEDLLDPAGLRDIAALLPLAPTPPPKRRLGFLAMGPKREATVAALRAAGMLRYARGLHLPDDSSRDEELAAATDLLNAALPALSELPDDVQALTRMVADPPPAVRHWPAPVAPILLGGSPIGRVDDAISGFRRHLALLPEGADSAPHRMNLAELWELRFRRTGDIADLDTAIDAARNALAVTADSDPKRSNRLTTLSMQLQIRFSVTGERGDLDAAIDVLVRAVEVSGPDHEDRSMYLSNLGRARTLAYQLGGDPDDLHNALAALRAAVAALDPDEHPSARGTRLGALHTALVLHYGRTDDPADLDEAFRVAREAAGATPSGDHNETDRVLDLAHAHALRHRHSGDPADAAEAARLAGDVLRATADGDPDRGRAQEILALTRSARVG